MKGRIEKRRRIVAFAYVDFVLTLCDVCYVLCVLWMFCLCVRARKTRIESEKERVCVYASFEFNSIQFKSASQFTVSVIIHLSLSDIIVYLPLVYGELEQSYSNFDSCTHFFDRNISRPYINALLIEHHSLYNMLSLSRGS